MKTSKTMIFLPLKNNSVTIGLNFLLDMTNNKKICLLGYFNIIDFTLKFRLFCITLPIIPIFMLFFISIRSFFKLFGFCY